MPVAWAGAAWAAVAWAGAAWAAVAWAGAAWAGAAWAVGAWAGAAWALAGVMARVKVAALAGAVVGGSAVAEWRSWPKKQIASLVRTDRAGDVSWRRGQGRRRALD